MSHFPDSLPPLDCHGHIATDVTAKQIDALDTAVVLAVTRTPSETRIAIGRNDSTLIWGSGVHPAMKSALQEFDPGEFRSSLRDLLFIGEVGLDRRGDLALQRDVFSQVMAIATDQHVLISIHSAGRAKEVLDLLSEYPHPGAILHWFTGDADQLARAIELDHYFSVNAAMPTSTLEAIPRNRLLPETDFPASTRSTRARKPGDIRALESRLSALPSFAGTDIRRMFWQNFRTIATRAGVLERLPENVFDVLIGA